MSVQKIDFQKQEENSIQLIFGGFRAQLPLDEEITNDEWELLLKLMKRECKKQQKGCAR